MIPTESSRRSKPIMTTAIQKKVHQVIDYPDDDGEPMSDNTLQFKWIVVIKEGLEALFRRIPSVFVAGNLLWYAVEGDPAIRCAPDVMVVFGRPKRRRGSYTQWEEDDIPPQVVFELLSPGNRPGEMTGKFEFYDKYGVLEYFIYDPDSGLLEGWVRAGNHLKPVTEMAHFISPQLGIRFEPGEGPDNLTIVGPDGERFLTYSELIDQRQAAEIRAEHERQQKELERQQKELERQQKEAERQLKEAEHKRAERYAAKLRELGIDPDADDGSATSAGN
jgi:Uma2 family endonuclease